MADRLRDRDRQRASRCWLGAATLLVACSGEQVAAPPPVPADWPSLARAASAAPPARAPTAKERATASIYVSALASPQLATITSIFDELGHVSFGRKDARTREKIQQLHQLLFGAFDQRKTAVTRVWLTDDTQIVEWTMTGVQARDWLGVPASQRPVAIRGVALLWTKDDGMITDAHLYFNVAGVKAQLGVGPKDLQERASSLEQPVAAAPPVEQASSQLEKDNVKAVRDELDAIENGKEAAYVGAFADDVDVYTLLAPAAHGKEEMRAYYKASRRAIGQLDNTIVTIKGIGDYVIVEYTVSGEQLAPVGPAASMDHSLTLYVTDVAEMRDGKISRLWRYDGADIPQ